MPKQIISMNVDSNIYTKYSKICRDEGLVMSKQIENFMKKFIEKEK